jgi:lycopene beta-cyclase
MTGYALPDAVRTATTIASAGDLSGAALHELTFGLARKAWKQRGFQRMLAAMLFRAAEPAERWRLLERFYRLDAGLIARFYAGRSSALDRLRLLSGSPQLPMRKALAAIGGKRG